MTPSIITSQTSLLHSPKNFILNRLLLGRLNVDKDRRQKNENNVLDYLSPLMLFYGVVYLFPEVDFPNLQNKKKHKSVTNRVERKKSISFWYLQNFHNLSRVNENQYAIPKMWARTKSLTESVNLRFRQRYFN